jgi:deoxyribose-phosphate aldolase
MKPSELAKTIDHTALRPDTDRARIVSLCDEARTFGFGAVCIAPIWIPLAREKLEHTGIKIVTVIGFPHGDTLTSVKAYETEKAIETGAEELDMVIPVGKLKTGDEDAVLHDILSVKNAAHQRQAILVKVILETPFLTDEEKVLACRLSEKAGADFVKTSTGFAGRAATVDDVELLRKTVGNRLGVKAAGGIRNLATALEMLKAGATRLGCSSSVSIMQEFSNQQ